MVGVGAAGRAPGQAGAGRLAAVLGLASKPLGTGNSACEGGIVFEQAAARPAAITQALIIWLLTVGVGLCLHRATDVSHGSMVVFPRTPAGGEHPRRVVDGRRCLSVFTGGGAPSPDLMPPIGSTGEWPALLTGKLVNAATQRPEGLGYLLTILRAAALQIASLTVLANLRDND